MNYQMKRHHLFYACGKKYLYDVNKNTILSVNDDIFNAIKEHMAGKHNDSAPLNALIAEGFLSDEGIETIEHPMSDILDDFLNNNVTRIILQVTQNCNLRCKYCAYSGSYINRAHTNKRMSFETAKKAIDFYMEHSTQVPQLRLSFYGGEPLLEFKLIQKCVEYIKSQTKKEVLFNLTTNATIFTKDILDYFVENKFFLTFSLDGSKEVQDKNRVYAESDRGTFDTVMSNVEWIRKEYPDYLNNISFNMVIDPAYGYQQSSEFFTYDERVDGMIVLSSEKNEVNFIDEYKTDDAYYENRAYENFKVVMKAFHRYSGKTSPLAENYVRGIKANMADRLKKDEIRVTVGHPSGPCIPGGQRLFVNVDGDFYPCERVNESADVMKIGNIDEGFDIENALRLLNIGKLTESSCKTCWALRFCTSCVMYAEREGKLSADVRLSNCARIKNSAEVMMREYCILKNLKLDFEEIENMQEDF